MTGSVLGVTAAATGDDESLKHLRAWAAGAGVSAAINAAAGDAVASGDALRVDTALGTPVALRILAAAASDSIASAKIFRLSGEERWKRRSAETAADSMAPCRSLWRRTSA